MALEILKVASIMAQAVMSDASAKFAPEFRVNTASSVIDEGATTRIYTLTWALSKIYGVRYDLGSQLITNHDLPPSIPECNFVRIRLRLRSVIRKKTLRFECHWIMVNGWIM